MGRAGASPRGEGDGGKAVLGRSWKDGPFAFHVLLLPTVPAWAVWSGNAGELRTLYPLRVMVGSVVAALVVLVIASIVQRDLRRSAVVATVSVVGATTIGYVLSDPARATTNLLALGGMVLLGVVVSVRLSEQRLRLLTVFANVIGAALVVANLAVVIAERPPPLRVAAESAVTRGDPGDARSVWYIIPDRYPAADDLASVGVDVAGFVGDLQRQGFTVYDRARANYPNTRLSLASAWGLELIEGRTGDDLGRAAATLADPAIGRTLRDAGLTYRHLGSWPDFTKTSASADQVLTLQGANEYWVAWEGTTILPTVRYLVDVAAGGNLRHARQLDHARYQFEVLDQLAAREPARPEFVLAHLVVPHGPYVLNADGTVREAEKLTDELARDGYTEQIAYLNRRLADLVTALEARQDPPIIVIMADEGLYPDSFGSQAETSEFAPEDYTVRDLELKLSILAAVKDPTGRLRELPEDTTAVNVTRAVVDAATGTTSFPAVDDTSFVWDPDSPEVLTPLVNVLASLRGQDVSAPVTPEARVSAVFSSQRSGGR